MKKEYLRKIHYDYIKNIKSCYLRRKKKKARSKMFNRNYILCNLKKITKLNKHLNFYIKIMLIKYDKQIVTYKIKLESLISNYKLIIIIPWFFITILWLYLILSYVIKCIFNYICHLLKVIIKRIYEKLYFYQSSYMLKHYSVFIHSICKNIINTTLMKKRNPKYEISLMKFHNFHNPIIIKNITSFRRTKLSIEFITIITIINTINDLEMDKINIIIDICEPE